MNTGKSFMWIFAPPHANARSNKFKPFVGAILIGLACLTSGCSTKPFNNHSSSSAASQPLPFKTVKVTAVGYGASSSYDGYSAGQKRLMAMRASKLDAYRALAEQVQGVRVNGNSTVATMVTQVDSFRVYVDAYLRGAQVITVTPMEDGNYETTMELTLDEQFFGTFEQQAKMVSTPGVVDSGNVKGSVKPGYTYGSNFYYSE